ncbi:MAG: hypothetical protein HQM09_17810 [Candidatus Riflebacteria bacterium]|nr:hypothetical protein [Candidatus Riflebacteria bacterium]
MNNTVKNIIKNTFLYKLILSVVSRFKDRKVIIDWKKAGRPIPPPSQYKQQVIKEYARKFSVHTLVETGTYCGDMVYASKNSFKRIISIELSMNLFEYAKERFSSFPHISILHGDSGEMLPGILAEINEPCLFWLDGHYSGDITAKGQLATPIQNELQCIFKHFYDHVILIDDARCFGNLADYPTINELRDLITQQGDKLMFEVQDDIIRIHRKR